METSTSKQEKKTVSRNKNKKQPIEVTAINKPSKHDSERKIKELSEFLSMAWETPKNP